MAQAQEFCKPKPSLQTWTFSAYGYESLSSIPKSMIMQQVANWQQQPLLKREV